MMEKPQIHALNRKIATIENRAAYLESRVVNGGAEPRNYEAAERAALVAAAEIMRWYSQDRCVDNACDKDSPIELLLDLAGFEFDDVTDRDRICVLRDRAKVLAERVIDE